MLEDTGFKTLIGIALWLQKNPDILSDIEKNRKTL
jgi:hypothetical protein